MIDVAIRYVRSMSSAHTALLSTVFCLAVFGANVDLQAQGPCQTQCVTEVCWQTSPPQGAGCGNCGEWSETDDIYNAGPNCVACGYGFCFAREKINIDMCAACDSDTWRLCLTCLT